MPKRRHLCSLPSSAGMAEVEQRCRPPAAPPPACLPACLPAVLVVEEYDKLDCPMRGFFRQLLENGQVANVSLNK